MIIAALLIVDTFILKRRSHELHMLRLKQEEQRRDIAMLQLVTVLDCDMLIVRDNRNNTISMEAVPAGQSPEAFRSFRLFEWNFNTEQDAKYLMSQAETLRDIFTHQRRYSKNKEQNDTRDYIH